MEIKMKIQVLAAAMNQSDHSLIEKMNIRTDAIIGNQCDRNSVEEFQVNGHNIKYLNFNERGVGLNRNNSLIRATGDILLFADEDEVFDDNYDSIIKKAYNELPDADAIIFNISTIGRSDGGRINNKIRRIRFYNCFHYGTVRLTVRNDSVTNRNITFHRQFGGGAPYSSGEDSLFIADLLKNRLKVYTYPAVIATVDQTDSSWFKGYTEKYFYDKGAFFSAFPYRCGRLLCTALLLKNRKSMFNSFAELKNGFCAAMKGYKHFRDKLPPTASK